MSVRGRIQTHGDAATCYRPVWETRAGRARSMTATTEVVPRFRIILEELSAEMTRKVFGETPEQTVRGMTLLEHPIEPEDRLVVESGGQAGTVYRVAQLVRYRRVAHQELALVAVEETIPIEETP